MRYLTKMIAETDLIFNCLWRNCSYKEGMDMLCNVIEQDIEAARHYGINELKTLSEDEKYISFARCYIDNIERAERTIKGDYQRIFNGELFKKAIYESDGKLKPLDETIYNELQRLFTDYEKVYGQIGKNASEEAKVIINGEYPRALKKLAKLDKHGAEILFEKIGDNKIQILFDGYIDDCVCIEKYTFSLLDNQDIALSDNSLYDHVKVLYEELFVYENNTFEYNILVEKWKNLNVDYEEISILFTKVRKKDTELKIPKKGKN